MKKILFRLNSSSNIGTGHLMRCLTLAKQYSGCNITFACENLEGNLNSKVEKEGYFLEVLKDESIQSLIEIINKNAIDFLVIDSYDIDYSFEKSIKDNCDIKILCFDDTYEKHYCDILLNTNIYADEKRYKELVPSWCKVQCGVRYSIIRDEFKIQKQRKTKKELLISIGGSDHLQLNIKIAKILLKQKRELLLHIVTTKANKNLARLKKFCRKYKNIVLHTDIDYMAKLMNRCCLSIVAASTIVSEAIFMKIPFIAIKTANNQEYMYKYLKKNHFKVMNKFSLKKLEQFSKSML
jgi:UDP-2,4-diacetamido-2,4,6-trideoxy-beta-L-altropyranose hydrolase